MKFKPVTEKYKFDQSVLTREYPDFLQTALQSWLNEVWIVAGAVDSYVLHLNQGFVNELGITLRKEFPRDLNVFYYEVFSDADLTSNLLALSLQNFATVVQAERLEGILDRAGSAYSVIFTEEIQNRFATGVADLIERVPALLQEAAEKAIDSEALLREAWTACYSRNPDYEKTVSRCCDVLEKKWGAKYFPKDPKPQVKKFIHAFRADPSKLAYFGSTIVAPTTLLSDLAENFSDIRGQHTAGKGRVPTKEEAVFVLHYTIFVWNLENQK